MWCGKKSGFNYLWIILCGKWTIVNPPLWIHFTTNSSIYLLTTSQGTTTATWILKSENLCHKLNHCHFIYHKNYVFHWSKLIFIGPLIVWGHSLKFSNRNYIFPLHSQKLVNYFGQISPDFAFLLISGQCEPEGLV